MYARAHGVSSLSSATAASYAHSQSEVFVLKQTGDTATGANRLPQTSRHRPTTQPTSSNKVFIREFTYPGEVLIPPAEPASNSIGTTAALQAPTAPGTVIEEDQLTQVEIPPQAQTYSVQQKRSNASSIRERESGMSSVESLQRQRHITVIPIKMDPKQLAQTYKLSDNVLKQYQEAFRIFDRDGDGCITCQELGTVMRSLGHEPTPTELQDMVNEVDVDGSGTIEFDEFVEMMVRRYNEKGGEEGAEDLQEAFGVFDRNKDGCITADELRLVMRSLGENLTDQELNEMMKAADANGDGVINFSEFQEVWLEAHNEATK